MKVRAYAKVNLALDVVRKRADGYHEDVYKRQVVMMMQRITKQIAHLITMSLKTIRINKQRMIKLMIGIHVLRMD